MKSKVKSAAKDPAKAARVPKSAAKPEKTPAKKATTKTPAKKTAAKAKAAPDAKVARTKRGAKKTAEAPELLQQAESAVTSAVKTAKARAKSEESAPRASKTTVKPAGAKRRKKAAEPGYHLGEPVLDPIGDTADGEGHSYLGEAEVVPEAEPANAEADAFRKETRLEASDAILEAGPGMESAQEAIETRARSQALKTAAAGGVDAHDVAQQPAKDAEPAKLERLQKILSQAGIASRRHAEEMIAEGRVMVNGQVVTTLGTKADPARDHIRVDGKLLHGAERHRYFLLNKPRGYVTTVSDPEGRPTVMKFFEKMHERLYPVGRLDYQSEGLLLMTNDGELANLLTNAGSGVEKTYLVKVAGRPTEEQLDRLRSGVTIERAEEGSGRVRTAPARVRQVRVGDNPWFEVVLTEGRNRELRKMFAAVGHFVEKIRRVGYGPLALDVEPGKMRELTADEVTALRLTTEGKMKPRRLHADRMLPKDAGMPAEQRAEKRGGRGGPAFGRRQGGPGPRRESGSFQRRDGGKFLQRDSGSFPRREGGRFPRRESGGFQREGGSRSEGTGFQRREAGGFQKRQDGGFQRREGGSGRPRSEGFGRQEGFAQRESRGFEKRERKDFGNRGDFRRGDRGGPGERRERKPFGGSRPGVGRPGFGNRPPGGRESAGFDGGRKPFRERGENQSGSGERRQFRPGGERPYFKRDSESRQRGSGPGEQRQNAPGRKYENGPRKNWGPRPERRENDGPRSQSRGPRQPAPEFRGQGKRFGGKKPGFGGRPGGAGGRPGGFGGPRRDGGRGGKPGGGRS